VIYLSHFAIPIFSDSTNKMLKGHTVSWNIFEYRKHNAGIVGHVLLGC